MGPGTSPEKEREMGWLPVQVCSGERVGSLGSLALEPWLVFWRVEGTSRWARRECPGLRARFHRKEWGGAPSGMEAGLYLCPLPGVVQRWMAGFRSFKPVFKLKSEAILLRQRAAGHAGCRI